MRFASTFEPATRTRPSVGDNVFDPHKRMMGIVSAEEGVNVTVTWADNQTDQLTYVQFAIAFEWLIGRWEMI